MPFHLNNSLSRYKILRSHFRSLRTLHCSTVFWHWTFLRILKPIWIFLPVMFILLLWSHQKNFFCSTITLLDYALTLIVLCKFFLTHYVPCQSIDSNLHLFWAVSLKNTCKYYIVLLEFYSSRTTIILLFPSATSNTGSLFLLDMWLSSISFCSFFLSFTLHVPYCVFQKCLFFFLLPICPSFHWQFNFSLPLIFQALLAKLHLLH